MDDRCLTLAEGYCSKRYLDSGRENLQSLHRITRSILAQRRCPEAGLSDLMIENLLTQLALMDANNFEGHIGAGEREGRVVAPMVQRRHFGLSHGVGRSGNLTEHQPKAAGSSTLYQVTNALVLDLLRLSGASSLKAALCVPMATGMTIALVLRAVAKAREQELSKAREVEQHNAGVENTSDDSPSIQSKNIHPEQTRWTPAEPRIVIFPRIDQKTALKCIDAAGFEAEVVPLRPAPLLFSTTSLPSCQTPATSTGTETDNQSHKSIASSTASISTHPFFLQVHVDDIAEAVKRVGGPRQVLCILSTTSCFAPRLPDDVVSIARYAKSMGIPYVINNAYGVQSAAIMKRIEVAQREHRVDYVVQSGDKNFLVPVGGAVVASSSEERVQMVAQVYAGRASGSPITDLFITALHLGRGGMRELWVRREAMWVMLVERLRTFARERGEMLLVEEMAAMVPPSSPSSALHNGTENPLSAKRVVLDEQQQHVVEEEESDGREECGGYRQVITKGDAEPVTLPPRPVGLSGGGQGSAAAGQFRPGSHSPERCPGSLPSGERGKHKGAAQQQQRGKVFPRNDISVAITMQCFGIEAEVGAHTLPGVLCGSPQLENSEVEDEKREAIVPPPEQDGAHTAQKQKSERRDDLDGGNREPRYAYHFLLEHLAPSLAERRRAACAEFGAKLFRSRVTGPRVILPAPEATTTICGKYRFRSYGCHEERPKCPLLVIACGIGMSESEVEELLLTMRKLWPAKAVMKK